MKKFYMILKLKPHQNKRKHNKGMKNIRQLIIKFDIPLEIIWIGGLIR